MANLVALVQRHMAASQLHKENPCPKSGEIGIEMNHPEELDQACISSVLAGVYQFTRDEQKAALLLKPKLSKTWLEVIFGGYPHKLEARISAYTGCAKNIIRQHLYAVAQKAVQEIRSVMGSQGDARAIKTYLTGQRMVILSRLPAALGVGALLNNTTLDDATNKMHGPFSDFMHWVETYLAEPQTPLY